MHTFIREKRTYCGEDYLEVDIIPLTQKHLRKRKRKRKTKISPPAQRSLNNKNSRRYFKQLVKANFKENDLYVTLTYKDKYCPTTIEEAESEITKFIRRLNYRRKKEGLNNAKYLVVTEGNDRKRIHHHLIIENMDRDFVESLWTKRKDHLGYVTAKRIQVDQDRGIEVLASYLAKDPAGRKRWRSSQNLEKPVLTMNDSKYSRRKVEQMALTCDDDGKHWAKIYPGWQMTNCRSVYNEIMGWSIYIELRRME